ncbi:sugar ABC transporter ATP-binding protein [Nocardioides endophyticus]|uniref:Sugar ABC transporter ATP-binding protein n=1 Tax=Nocardioides endophyticus TaxID=1353775 RepID=A0ABP8YYT1_9ACTN
MTSASPRLEMLGISKTFGQHRVLSEVDLVVGPGEIRGLAGQNGSGKSTLIKILTGVHRPDPGSTIRVDGAPLDLPVRWTAAHAAGIAVVHQDLGLLDHLTVAENVCVGGFPTRHGRIDRRRRDRLAARTLERIGADVSPLAVVGELTAAERAEVAIARALRDHAPGGGLIVLDESTRLLRGADLERAHTLLRRLAETGSSILLISHSMSELQSLPGRVTVLRDGRVSADLGVTVEPISEARIARAMLGDAVDEFRRGTRARPADDVPRVRVEGLTGAHVREAAFEIGRGEVLGITGAPASGYEEIPLLLTGARAARAGTAQVGEHSVDLTRAGVRHALRAGIVLVPERRDRDGLALELSVADNVTLPRLGSRSRFYLSRSWRDRQAARAIRDHGVRPAAPRALVRELSGGNQQKALLAKWLSAQPVLLVLHEPTQAVDVGARRDILARISAAADDGASVLVVSSEADDLAAVCDRVLVCTSEGDLVETSSTDSAVLLDHVFATYTEERS